MAECLFCRIISREIPADIVYEDESSVAFRDVQPQSPVHILVVPRKHITGFLDVGADDETLVGRLARTVARVAEQEDIAGSGFRSVVNSGSDAQQSVDHLHIHVLGGRQMSWPPG